MSVTGQISSKASQLPPELQAEVLDFIQSLADKKAKEQEDMRKSHPRLPNKFGAGKGLITYIADDFDEPLDELEGAW